MSGQVPYVSQSVGMTAADAQQVGTNQTVVASTTSLTDINNGVRVTASLTGASITGNCAVSGNVSASSLAVTGAITFSSINSTPIGATTPSTGAFTTLTASGNISATLDASIHGMTVGTGGGSVATNTAVGVNALYYNTTGYYNTASGSYSLVSNTTGNYNTASGYGALYTNTTGPSNTAIGFQSLHSNTTGASNDAHGQSSLFSNTSGYYNVALGYQAGYGAAGVNANTTGSNNTFLGFETVGAGGADTNEIVIGANAVGLGSNTTVIGSASTTMSNIKGRVLIGTTTDDGVNALQVNGAGIFAGLIKPQQATTAGAPAYVKGAIYFDTTLNKLRIGGATAWETITSI